MKILSLSSLLLLCFMGFSQSPDRDTVPETDPYIPKKEYPYISATVEFGTLSDGMSTTNIIDFTSDDYLDNSEKDDLLSQMGSRFRFGYFRIIDFEYRVPSYQVFDKVKLGQGFRIRNRYYNSASLDNDIVNLLFYGNKPYVDQTLTFDRSGYETWYFTSLDYTFDVLLDSLQPMALTVGIELGHDHNSYKLASGQLYTAPDGEYLDVMMDYRLRDKTGETSPLEGLGIGLGAETTFKTGRRGKFQIKVEDLGFIYWNNGRKLDTDSTFRYRGATIDNIFDINDSLMDNIQNEYRKSFLYEEEGDYMALLPFYLCATYSLHFKGAVQDFFLAGDYRYLIGFMPRLTAGINIRTAYTHRLITSVSTGGYNWFSFNVGYQFEFADDWQMKLGVQNLSGLLLPTPYGGGYGSISLRYEI